MRTMSMDNILGDPFALATISIAVVCYDYSSVPQGFGALHENDTDNILHSLLGSSHSSGQLLRRLNILHSHSRIILGSPSRTCYA